MSDGTSLTNSLGAIAGINCPSSCLTDFFFSFSFFLVTWDILFRSLDGTLAFDVISFIFSFSLILYLYFQNEVPFYRPTGPWL